MLRRGVLRRRRRSGARRRRFGPRRVLWLIDGVIVRCRRAALPRTCLGRFHLIYPRSVVGARPRGSLVRPGINRHLALDATFRNAPRRSLGHRPRRRVSVRHCSHGSGAHGSRGIALSRLRARRLRADDLVAPVDVARHGWTRIPRRNARRQAACSSRPDWCGASGDRRVVKRGRRGAFLEPGDPRPIESIPTDRTFVNEAVSKRALRDDGPRRVKPRPRRVITRTDVEDAQREDRMVVPSEGTPADVIGGVRP
jgi:hypothetical protein